MSLHAPNAGLFAVPLLLALWSFRGPLSRSPWPAFVAIAYFARIHVKTMLGNIRAPHEWDYACFWLYGHIAAAHRNVYDPSVFAHFPSPFTPSPEFVQAVVNVGFPYPPPAIALFLPLGYFTSVPAGLAVWYAVQILALAGAAWILARTFMPDEKWASAVFIFAIVLALPATQPNLSDAQTNFLVLLAIALALAGRTAARGGVWQMLAVWIKPFTGALFIVDIVHGQWRKLGVAAATAVVSLAVAALIIGPQAMLDYVRSSPAGREPAFTFVESVNQSLLAVVLRAQHAVPAPGAALHQPLFILISLALLGITVALCARAPRGSSLAFALCLLFGMLVYPATLTSYGVALVIPLIVLWSRRDELPGKSVTLIAVAFIVTFLQGGPQFGFAANLVLWFVIAGTLAAQRHPALVRQTNPRDTRPAFAETR